MTAADKTFLELCNDVKRECGIAGAAIAAVTGQAAGSEYERVVNWVPDADQLIQELWEDWKFLHGLISITTTSGTRAYSLTTLDGVSDVATISTSLLKWDEESFVYKPASDNAAPLVHLPYKEWRKSERLGATASIPSDVPSKVTIKPNNDLAFYPTPNDVGPITADYQKRAVRMTANGDTSVIPAPFRRIITARAKMMYAEHENNPAIYNAAETEYGMYLGRLESNQLPDAHWKFTSQGAEADLEVVVE